MPRHVWSIFVSPQNAGQKANNQWLQQGLAYMKLHDILCEFATSMIKYALYNYSRQGKHMASALSFYNHLSKCTKCMQMSCLLSNVPLMGRFLGSCRLSFSGAMATDQYLTQIPSRALKKHVYARSILAAIHGGQNWWVVFFGCAGPMHLRAASVRAWGTPQVRKRFCDAAKLLRLPNPRHLHPQQPHPLSLHLPWRKYFKWEDKKRMEKDAKLICIGRTILGKRLDILKWLQMTSIQSEYIWAQFGNRIAGACRDQWA